MLHAITQTQYSQQNMKHSSLKKKKHISSSYSEYLDFGFHNYNSLHPRYDTDRVKINPLVSEKSMKELRNNVF